MSRPSFTASPTSPHPKYGDRDVMVNVTHWPSNTAYLITANEAEAWGMALLKAADEAKGKPLFCEAGKEGA